MLYLLDTADLNAIEELIRFYPISGVTTNPTILAKNGRKDLKSLFLNIRKIIGNERSLHIQALGKDSSTIVNEAKLLSELLGENTFIKIPVMREGIKAILEIKKQKIKIGITATGIMSPQQALIAGVSGAHFVAPYINRSDNHNEDGAKMVSDIKTLFEINKIDCKILGASFKNVKQIQDTMLAGSNSITVDPSLFERLIYHSITDLSIADFKKDWESLFDKNKTLLDSL